MCHDRQELVVKFTDGVTDVGRIIMIVARMPVRVVRIEISLPSPQVQSDVAVILVEAAEPAKIDLLAARLRRIVTVLDVSCSRSRSHSARSGVSVT